MEEVSASNELYASINGQLGVAYRQHPIGDRGDNLRQAITRLNLALENSKPEDNFIAYAQLLNSLANSYADLDMLSNTSDDLIKAIEYYEQALKYVSPQISALDYAGIVGNLAQANIT